MHRLYFIQDYEPYFYPHGPEYALAEDSYRFGFRCIALGNMVATALRTEVCIDPEVTPFGCDTDVYRLCQRGREPVSSVTPGPGIHDADTGSAAWHWPSSSEGTTTSRSTSTATPRNRSRSRRSAMGD